MDMPGGTDTNDPTPVAQVLLELLHRTYVDVHHHPPRSAIGLDSSLDRDLGFDSLARVELLLRIERAFGVQLPDAALSRAESGRDLLALLGSARPSAAVPATGLTVEPALAPGTQAPPGLKTLVEVLEWHARQQPQRVHLRVLEEVAGELQERPIAYGALREDAEAIAAGLQGRGLEPRQTVAIMLPTGVDYFACYFGVLIAGGVPVPIYPPLRASQVEEHLRRQRGILGNAEARLLITVPEASRFARLLQASVPELRHVLTPDALRGPGGRLVRLPVAAEDIAFIQYTSGSTGSPKGVVLTHANLLANIRAFGRGAAFGPDDVLVSWLPLYHDMGLIAAWLGALYHGIPLVVMSPISFLARPERWLRAIHRYRGTLTAAPNFAYELCLKRIDDASLAGVDLSSLRLAANGSEQVRPETLARFTARFARFGLRADAVQPVYGLAEATVGLALPPPGRPARIDRVRRERFVRTHRAEPAAADDAQALAFASCGRVLPGHELRVVDESGAPLAERIEGQLQFRGPSATQGYYRNPEQSRRLFRDGWVDTGDRAYLAEGELFLTGRVKDIIIRGGRNLYPDEIEQAVDAIPGVRRGCVCAFGVPDAATGTERLVVLAETREHAAARAALHEAVAQRVAALLGEPADEIVLASPGSVLKTSSGKLRRAATRERWLAGGGAGARGQALRLLLATLAPALRRLARRAGELGYAAWVWSVLALAAPPVWLLTALAPTPAFAWAVNHRAARALLRLAGIALELRGLQRLLDAGPHLLVANHASYLDGLVLLASLPRPYRFVAKTELQRQGLVRRYLARLGVEFVERFQIRDSVRDAARITALARAGQAFAFFPEGTFAASPGLLPFHLGAFVTAVEAGLPVVPLTLRGTRAILRGEERLPRRGAVQVIVGEPIAPAAGEGDAFRRALALRDAARAQILAGCGEPDAGAS